MEVKEVAGEFPWSARVIYNGLADGSFPVPAKRKGRKWIFDRKKLEEYLEALPDEYVPRAEQGGSN